MKGIALMYGPSWKKVGIIISAIGLIFLMVERLFGVIIFKELSLIQHSALFEWVMLLGLIMIIYSRERDEDDRTKMVRLKSFQLAFIIMVGLMMNSGLLKIMNPDRDMSDGSGALIKMSALGTILYLLSFHIGLYFDVLWEYQDVGIWANLQNIKKDKWGIVTYLLICAISIITIIFL